MTARIEITYCTQCRWLLRAGWLAQELLSTFGTDLGGVTLVPGTGGVFTVDVAGPASGGAGPTRIWDRRDDGGFPDAAELKRRVRDVVDPERSLGHGDR